MSRAGLVAFVLFFLCITLAASAPLPDQDIESFATRSGDYDHDLIGRSPDFDSLEDRGLSFLKERDFDLAVGNLYTRDLNEPLYRRTKITQKINAAFHKAGAAIKKDFQKAGAGIKKAAQKVGGFIKKTGAVIAKVGLKIYSAAAGVASTVARFIPGVGSAVSGALKAASKVADVASNAIKAPLSKKLQKGMNVLNVVKDPIGAAAGAAANKARKKK